jgi:hypothetical protein
VSGPYQDRHELLALAEMLNKHRNDLLNTVNKLTEATSLLVNEAERLLPAAMAEREEMNPSTVRALKLGYGQAKVVDPQLAYIGAEGAAKRRCGNEWCREPGHIARNCPNPRPGAPPEKKRRKMKPLTEEQKAQRRASLVKARAARRPK